MTPEEIQQIFQQMLAVQRDLQEKQLKNTEDISRNTENISRNTENISRNTENISRLTEDITRLTEDISQLRDGISLLADGVSELIDHSKSQDKRLDQLIGYSITAESDRLDLEERVRVLERKIRKIENVG